MSNFVERLNEYMQERILTQKYLAEKHGIPSSTLSALLLGKNMPSYSTLAKLLYVFDCSADFLLGVDEYPTEEKLFPVIAFEERFKEILSEKNISQGKIKRDLHYSTSVLYKWVSGKAEPSAVTLIRLAEYLDCSVDYLMGRRR